MALKYPFRRLVFKGLLRPKRLYEELQLLDERITDLEDSNSTLQSLDERITALEGSNSTPSTNDEPTG